MQNCIDKKYDRLLIDDYSTYRKAKRLYARYADEHPLKIEYYRDHVPMFERFNVEKEIEKSLRRKIWLQSGGYLFFDKTEAMYTVDINSGRSKTGDKKDLEETLVQINLEAAQEIARQLRIRNIGGLVIIDFIDMRLRKNQRRVLERLKSCMKDDGAKSTVLNMSEFGLVEMTRQRNRESLMQTLCVPCPYCKGTSLIKSHETVVLEIERSLKKIVGHLGVQAIRVTVHPLLMDSMKEHGDVEFFQKFAKKLKADVEFETSDNLHMNAYEFASIVANQPIEI